MGSEHLFLDQLQLIERAIRAVCRRQRLSPTDGEDFAGAVRLHLIDDDYAVLRKFQGRSSLKTFLIAVIAHRYQDWRNSRWGKWRPSTEARRQGPLAMHLEQLIGRDGLTFDEAYETLKTNWQVPESRQALEAMAATLPVRTNRHFVPEDSLEDHADASGTADATVRRTEAGTAAARASTLLTGAMDDLPAQDRLILKMRFEDDVPIADIAQVLKLEAKPLYRRIEQLLKTLRARLEQSGLSASAVVELLAGQGFDFVTAAIDRPESAESVRPFDRGGTRTRNVGTP